jgi:6-pyruvoyl-tetrahydropterin synthase
MKISYWHRMPLGPSYWPFLDLLVSRRLKNEEPEVETRLKFFEKFSKLSLGSGTNIMDLLLSLREQGSWQDLTCLEACSRQMAIISWTSDLGFSLRRDFILELAHFLPHVPQDHKCRRLHGHSYGIGLQVKQAEDSNRLLLEAEARISKLLDRRLLNNVEGLENPTAEILASYIFEKLKPSLANLQAVMVNETLDSACSYKGGNIWGVFKAFELESALPHGDSFLGRSLRIRLGIEKELDPDLGWTLDFAQIKSWFRPIKNRLDHHNLGEIDGRDLSQLRELGQWIFCETLEFIPGLKSIEIEDSAAGGMILERL